MRAWLRLTVTMLFLACAGGVRAAPLEAYGKLPTLESVTVSPSGHAIAVVVTDGEARSIVVKDLDSGEITLRGLLGQHKVRSVQWAGDKHLVVVASITKNNLNIRNGHREWVFGSLIDLDAKKIKPLMAKSQADLAAIFGQPLVRVYQGKPNLFVQGIVFSGGMGQLSLFRINLENGSNRLVQVGSTNTTDWVVDAEGQPLAQEVEADGVWSLVGHTDAGWKTLVTIKSKGDMPYLLGLGRDSRSLIYVAPDEEGVWAWREARTDGRPAGPAMLFADDQYPLRAAQDGRMVGHAALVGDELRYTFYEADDAHAWKLIQAAFPGERVELLSVSTDRNKIIVRVDSPTIGPSFALVDLAKRKAEWLGTEYMTLEPPDISKREPIRYRAADGLELSGYLTTPNGRPAKGLPLIVLVHGGPAARDAPGFDWWSQAIASRGYAVLQVNFRGSDGLGSRLLEAGYGQWGAKMQTDLSDGVRALVSRGVVDPKRVCIVGASYGGYAALAGAVLDHGVYRCSVAISAPTDLRKLVADSNRRFGAKALRYWNRFMGVKGPNDPRLDAISPIELADKADVPILLIHGTDDTVVPVAHSRDMADALRKAGKPVELLVQAGEDHWMSRGQTRLEMLTASMAFLERHNPPQ